MSLRPRLHRPAWALLLGVAWALTVVPALAARPPAAVARSSSAAAFGSVAGLRHWTNEIVRLGFDAPEAALAQIAQVQESTTQPPVPRDEWAQALWRTRGYVAAMGGYHPVAREAVAQLQRMAERASPERAAQLLGDSLALQVALAAQLEEPTLRVLAQQALAQYDSACPELSTLSRESQDVAALSCDDAMRWRVALHLARRLTAQGEITAALAATEIASASAERLGDETMRVVALTREGQAYLQDGDVEAATAVLAQARHVTPDKSVQSALPVKLLQAAIAAERGEQAGAGGLLRQALDDAKRAKSQRWAAVVQVARAQWLLEAGQLQATLLAVEEALPVLARYGDIGFNNVLHQSHALALLGLGRVAEGRAELELCLRIWERTRSQAQIESVLRQYSRALAAAGDWRGAIDLYHREQAVGDAIMVHEREAALVALRSRHQAALRESEVAALERANALKVAEIGSRRLSQQVWGLLAMLALVTAAAVVWLVWRARRSASRLRAHHATLSVQSQRDPLTGLVNRRHLLALLNACSPGGRFAGTLAVLDVDHFKQVNDRHGHAVGDAVLLSVGEQLVHTMRMGDTIGRWGGEEFLLVAPQLTREAAPPLMARLLAAVAAAPPALGAQGEAVRVTASIGWVHLPLPGTTLTLNWERALQLADLALYRAKRDGRNCAVGLTQATLATEADWAALQVLQAESDSAHPRDWQWLVTRGDASASAA